VSDGALCGFVATSEDRGSEGCTASIDTSAYRDYSSYFFSAIHGMTINGENLAVNTDLNNDGAVTLKKAHIYILSNALAIDLSRSTSDDYLVQWQPWYFSWVPELSEPDNLYSDISRRIALRISFKEKAKHSFQLLKIRNIKF
jgi:hypothetical protein